MTGRLAKLGPDGLEIAVFQPLNLKKEDAAMLQNLAKELQACIANCRECHDACLHLVPHCLGRGGRHAEPGHITLLLDCAQICDTSADFMVRGSDLHGATCGACAEVCERCADYCQRLGNDDND